MGQVRQLGFDESGESFDMIIHSPTVLEDVNLGDSIAVNGTCLTVTEFDPQRLEFKVGLAPETLRKTSLIELEQGSVVNLERAVKPSTRMGGHFVQGHVDGTGEIVSMEPEGDSLWIKVKTSPEILKFIVPKGFIAVDGTSLTVVKVFDEEECFNFMLVEYTQQKVVIPLKKVGQKAQELIVGSENHIAMKSSKSSEPNSLSFLSKAFNNLLRKITSQRVLIPRLHDLLEADDLADLVSHLESRRHWSEEI
ncbi:ATPase, F1/A1 complex, alpha subunit, N-terminal [Cynara cardunculus var. scolymus]|uniref:Riboflavin synthase n=1 Tax=Cynara cardunculus var. scolymus TaxID=59895 RepID=A0A103Y1I8_CYNCS|nr:ATPase, F1/A1 complex, alpha subunit, N-terminal [Cynara cardunculus var. scolymus]